MSESTSEARRRIRALLAVLLVDDDLAGTVADTAPLRQAGLSSVALVSLLVAMEDEFGFAWDDDVAPESLRSIGSLADHVVTLGV